MIPNREALRRVLVAEARRSILDGEDPEAFADRVHTAALEAHSLELYRAARKALRAELGRPVSALGEAPDDITTE